MSSSNNPEKGKDSSMFKQPLGISWRKALVSLPRLVPDAAVRFLSPEGPYPIIAKIPSRSKHQIPLHIFIPPSITTTTRHSTGQTGQSASCPVLLDFHGGGFVLGSCQEQAPFCAKLCRELNCIAISVDYRLGPYAQFPAAVEDAEDVLNAIIDPSKPGYTELREIVNSSLAKTTSPPSTIDLDTTRLAISGFSSGGNLAFNLALNVPTTAPLLPQPWPSLFPQSHTNPIPLLLFYPALDTRQLPHERPMPPGLDPPKGFFASLNLETELMPTYLPRHLSAHPRASPALVSVNDGNLHPAAKMLLVLPEFDSLADQSAVWTEKVKKEGRGEDLEVISVKGMGHGWTQFPDGWLEEEARRRKWEVFGRAKTFVGRHWSVEESAGPGR